MKHLLNTTMMAVLSLAAAACNFTMIDSSQLGRVLDTTSTELTISSPAEGFACANIVEIRGKVADATNDGDIGRITALSWEVPGTAVRATSTPIETDGSFIIQFETLSLSSSFSFTLTAVDWNGNTTTRTLSLVKDAGDSLPSFSAVPRNKGVDLSWEPVPNTTGYVLYYSTDGSLPSDSNGNQVELSADTTAFALDGCVNGNAYCFRLRAVPSPGWTESRSAYLKTIPLSLRTLSPQAEGGFDHISLSWNGISSTDTYEIWRRKGESGEFSPFTQVSGTSYTDRSVESCQWYYYKVKPLSGSPILSEPTGAQTIPFLQSPAIVRSLPETRTVSDLAIGGTWLYAADESPNQADAGGLQVWDISNPGSPILVKTIPMHAKNIVVQGNRAYATSFWFFSDMSPEANDGRIGKLRVLDISDPRNACELGQTALEDVYSDSYSQPVDLAVSGGRVYVATGGGNDGDGIQVFDIDEDGTPVFAEAIPMPVWPGNGSIDSPVCLAVRDGYAYVGGLYGGLYTIELSNRSVVDTISKIEAEDGWASSIRLDGDFLYLADGRAGLQIYRIAGSPAAPVFIQRVDNPGSALDVAVQGSFAYLADGSSGLQMVDIRPTQDGTPLQLLKAVQPEVQVCSLLPRMWTSMPSSAGALAVSGSWAYVAATYSGIQVVDLANPAGAVPEKTIPVADYLGDAALLGSRAYFMEGSGNLRMMDLSDPANPSQQVVLSGLYSIYRMVLSGSMLIGVGPNSLSLVDLRDPAMPVRIMPDDPQAWGVYPTGLSIGGGIGKPAVSGDYLYIPSWDYGLSVLDISDPRQPVTVAQVNTGKAHGVAISGSRAYVACSAGLAIVDISYPLRSKVLQTIPFSYDDYSGQNVSVSGNYAYVCDQRKGIQIVDIRDPENAFLAKTVTPYVDPDDYNAWPSYTSIAVHGTWAIAPTATGSISVINISNPAQAVLSAQIFEPREDLNGGRHWTLVSGGFAYISDLGTIQVVRLIP